MAFQEGRAYDNVARIKSKGAPQRRQKFIDIDLELVEIILNANIVVPDARGPLDNKYTVAAHDSRVSLPK